MSGPSPEAMVKAVYGKLLRVPSKIASRGAIAITKSWRASYRAGRSPDGQTWAPLAASTVRRKGHARVMQDTEATLDETRALAVRGSGIRLTTGPRACYHMAPHGTRPARRVAPVRMPSDWTAILARIADDENRKAVR